jgi:hypothetical protein
MMRSRRREFRPQWSALLSAPPHVSVALARGPLLAPDGGSHLAQANPSIHISPSYAHKGDESLKAEVPPERPRSGQKSDALRTHPVPESEASFAPEGGRGFEPLTVQASQGFKPPDHRLPTSTTPQFPPSTSASRPITNGHRKDPAPERPSAITRSCRHSFRSSPGQIGWCGGLSRPGTCHRTPPTTIAGGSPREQYVAEHASAVSWR